MNQGKWVYGSFMFFSALVGYVFWKGSYQLAGYWDLETQIPRLELVLQGVGLLAAAITMAILSFNGKYLGFMNEVVLEIGKMTWPQKKETVPQTIAVIVMVLICGGILGFFDWGFGAFLEALLSGSLFG